MMTEEQLNILESKLLLEAVHKVYGYDFRQYAEATLQRRLTNWLETSEFATFSEAQSRILRDRNLFDSLLCGITVNVTEMFRDPAFFKAIREQVVSYLKTYPFVKIWHAGCASGEEAYSMAILLYEEGLSDRFRIYATDINQKVISKARKGIYPLGDLQRFTQNYQSAGGKAAFAEYYTARYDHAILSSKLRDSIVFAEHNLACDAGFGDMNLILCRNVMIYFKEQLKERVLELFDSCLMPGGFLCLGTKETLVNRSIAGGYQLLVPRMQIYQKLYEKV